MNVGLRILLIEDEARIIELVSRALAREGFVVDAFSTCADGHEALSHIQYDAAILDLGLPDGDGLALLAAIRSRGNKLPILVLTANTGADDYLVKPFAMSELIARAKALLRSDVQESQAHDEGASRRNRIGFEFVIDPVELLLEH
jgi:two-component system response regulator QseB